MLHSTTEFLNLKTLGEGIVKAVGLDQSAAELLTGSEIDALKANLELRALTILQASALSVVKTLLPLLLLSSVL